MRKAKHPARGHQFCNLVRRNGKPPFAQAQQDERLHFEFGRDRHKLGSVTSGFWAAAASVCRRAESSRASSSDDKNPSGCTTGTTVWSSAVSPRYHCRSSWQKHRGSDCSRVMLLIFSMPSIKSAVRVLRSTNNSAPSAACSPKCMAPLTMKSERSPRRTTWRTFRIPGTLISVAAPDMLSALRTSCTAAEETANNCPLTRKRMICSVFVGLGFTGAARRISELPRGPCDRFPGHVFRWRHKYRRFPAPDRRRQLLWPQQACQKSRTLLHLVPARVRPQS